MAREIVTAYREENGIQVLHLGEVEVGRVATRGGRNDRPRWLFQLDNHLSIWRTERTVEKAEAALEARLADWLKRAALT